MSIIKTKKSNSLKLQDSSDLTTINLFPSNDSPSKTINLHIKPIK